MSSGANSSGSWRRRAPCGAKSSSRAALPRGKISRRCHMRRLTGFLCAAVIACSGAKAAEMHVSHFGQVMPSVPWIVALEQDLFRKNGVDITDVISAAGGGSTLRNLLAGGIPFGEVATAAAVNGIKAGLPVKIIGFGVR